MIYLSTDRSSIFLLAVARGSSAGSIYLYSTDPTQETCATVKHAGGAAPTRQHEPDYTDQESMIYFP